jgi:DNA-binding IclR family transcriptional regulator
VIVKNGDKEKYNYKALYIMQIVTRVFELLKLLRHYEELSLKEITIALEISSNSGWNLLNSLTKLGITQKTGPGKYSLGTEYYNLFSSKKHEETYPVIKPDLQKLATDIKESVVAVFIAETELEVIASVTYEQDLMVNERIFFRKDTLYNWATGHLALAWQSDSIKASIIEKKGLPTQEQWPAVKTEKDLNLELEKLRDAEFAEREYSQIYSLAVPVLKENGDFLMAIGVCFPAIRNTSLHHKIILAHLRITAEEIARKLCEI